METKNCKGCGKPMIFAIDTNGTTQILDPRPPIYGYLGERPDGTPLVRQIPRAWVSHFATCSKASEFSKNKKGSALVPPSPHKPD